VAITQPHVSESIVILKTFLWQYTDFNPICNNIGFNDLHHISIQLDPVAMSIRVLAEIWLELSDSRNKGFAPCVLSENRMGVEKMSINILIMHNSC
jgi:hypothetical protein